MRKRLLSFCFASLIVIFGLVLSGSALDRQPAADYHARREALAKKAGGVVLLFAPLEGRDSVYAFLQDDNFYYLSGITVPGAALLIAPAADAQWDSPARPYTEILFLPPRNLRMEKYTGVQLGADNPDAPKITGFDRVADMGKLPEEVSKLLANGRPVVYSDVASPNETPANPEPLAFLKRTNAVVVFQDVKPMLASLRTVKDAGEITLLRKAVDASVAAHFAAMKAVKPNVTEYKISATFGFTAFIAAKCAATEASTALRRRVISPASFTVRSDASIGLTSWKTTTAFVRFRKARGSGLAGVSFGEATSE